MEELEKEQKMSCVEELNKVSPSSSWVFVDDCDHNEEENSEKNVYYLNCENVESYDKLEETDSDSVSIISESDEDLEPTPIDDIPDVPDQLLHADNLDEDEYLCSKFLTCGCIFLAIFTPILINCVMTEKPQPLTLTPIKVEIEKFLGLDPFDTDTPVDYDVRPSNEILELISDSSDDIYTPTFFDPKKIIEGENDQIDQEECSKDNELDLRDNQIKEKQYKKYKRPTTDDNNNAIQDLDNNKPPHKDKKPYHSKKQKKGDKFKRQGPKKPYKKSKYEKAKGEFPSKYKEKSLKKHDKSCSDEITKLKTLLDNQEAKIRQLSRLLTSKDRDIKLLERRIKQEIKDLKQMQKTYKQSKRNTTLSGEWYNNYFDERGKLRNREQAASWLFDRAEYRNRKRNRRDTWYIDWMSQREAERTKRDDWRFSY